MKYEIKITEPSNLKEKYKEAEYFIFVDSNGKEKVKLKSGTVKTRGTVIVLSDLAPIFTDEKKQTKQSSLKKLFDHYDALALKYLVSKEKQYTVQPKMITISKDNGKNIETKEFRRIDTKTKTFIPTKEETKKKEIVKKTTSIKKKETKVTTNKTNKDTKQSSNNQDFLSKANTKLVSALQSFESSDYEMCLLMLRQALDQLTYAVQSNYDTMTQLKSESLVTRLTNTLKRYGMASESVLRQYKDMINVLNDAAHGNDSNVDEKQVYDYIQLVRPLIEIENIKNKNTETIQTKEETDKPYWIHEKRKDIRSVTGYVYRRDCKCSNCGYHSNMEKKICPQCGSLMQHE